MNLRHKAGAAEDNINIKCRHHLFFKKAKKSEKKKIHSFLIYKKVSPFRRINCHLKIFFLPLNNRKLDRPLDDAFLSIYQFLPT